MLVKPSPEDYEWVKKTLRKHPKGLSPKDLDRISTEETDLGIRFMDSNPPSREKIYKIIEDHAGKDFEYELGGGRGRGTVVKLKKDTPLLGIGRKVNDLLISEKIRVLDSLYEKKSKRFRLKDIIELSLIKDAILSYPTSIFYNDSRHSNDRDILFTSALGISKDQIARIKKIETIQRKLNSNFDKTVTELDRLKNSKLIEIEIFGNRKVHRDVSLIRNNIKALYKIE